MRLKRTSLMRVATGTLPPAPRPKVAREQDCAALHGRLAQQHARHQRMARIMAGEEPFVAAERLAADDPRVGPLDDLVDQQERVAVRDGGEDFLAGHGRSHSMGTEVPIPRL